MDKHKLKILLETVKVLNQLGITPVVYGSFGLAMKLEKPLPANDLDLIIPDQFVKKNWEEFVLKMEEAGFALENKDKREFSKEGEMVGFNLENEMKTLIDFENLKEVEMEGVKFKELSLEQHLNFYKKVSLDPERQKKKGKADQMKIKLIKEALK